MVATKTRRPPRIETPQPFSTALLELAGHGGTKREREAVVKRARPYVDSERVVVNLSEIAGWDLALQNYIMKLDQMMAAGKIDGTEYTELYTTWKDEHPKPRRKYAVVEDNVDPNLVFSVQDGGWAEPVTAEKVGIDVGLDLVESCATFYVLEAMRQDLFPAVGFEWSAERQRLLPVRNQPADFGADSKTERRGYAVMKTLDDLERRLADQFSKYMVIACGGELRHTNRFRPGTAAWRDRPDMRFKVLPKTFECQHVDECDKVHRVNRDGSRRPLREVRAEQTAEEGVLRESCEHVCSVDSPCIGLARDRSYVIGPLVQEYLEMTQGWVGGGRSGSWWLWWNLAKDDPVPWMVQCAQAFMSPQWLARSGSGRSNGIVLESLLESPEYRTTKTGYGGPLWATAAGVAADYLAGNIKARTFIDRCWSLQHNGGTIFSKVFRSSTNLVTLPSGRRTDRLMGVLQLQADHEYDWLMHYATPYAQTLWREHVVETGQHAWTDAILFHLPKVEKTPAGSIDEWRVEQVGTEGDEAGCAACFWNYLVTGTTNPCWHAGVSLDDDEPFGPCQYKYAFDQAHLEDDPEPEIDCDHHYHCNDCGNATEDCGCDSPSGAECCECNDTG